MFQDTIVTHYGIIFVSRYNTYKYSPLTPHGSLTQKKCRHNKTQLNMKQIFVMKWVS